jgi:polar amino acid transport system substrate-binding protein
MRAIPSTSLAEPAGQTKITNDLGLARRRHGTVGFINENWNKWLGPDTEYKMTRTDKVVPLSELKFEPIP